MLLQMRAELIYFAVSILVGAAAALLGAGMDLLHGKCRRLTVWLGILDLLYWFGMALVFFLLCFRQNSGVFRGYAAAGTMAGYIFTKKILKNIAKRIKKAYNDKKQ